MPQTAVASITPDSFSARIARNLRTAREQAGLTQQQVALKLGVGYRSYQAWEGVESTPNARGDGRRKGIVQLAVLYGKDPGWFYQPHDDQDDELAEPERAAA